MTGDYPAFVKYICDFIRAHAGIELAAYYEAKPGSRYDLESKRDARAAYRSCITPLGIR